MALPRSFTVIPGEPGVYHCTARCVRRAWLCGDDRVTGLNFDHRRGWIEHKALELAGLFAVGLYGYAVMSNHLHLVIAVDPSQAGNWSDDDVADRWSKVTRHLHVDDSDAAKLARDQRREAILGDVERLREVRYRLGDLSWFMRYLNETIARAANQEDGCAGRFWEGRFSCKALRDNDAILGSMAYVDLNPIRAGLANDLAGSEYTSVRRHCQRALLAPEYLALPLGPMAGITAPEFPHTTVAAYLDLVEASGRQISSGKVGSITGPPLDLDGLRCAETHWLRLVTDMESWFGAAVGGIEALRTFAQCTGRRWVHGVSGAW